jgi:hypothetical protein
MVRVWTCLAVAMTAGAVLLSWLERGAPVAPMPRSTSALLAEAQSAVGQPADSLRPWSGIVLVGVSAGAAPSALAATRPQEDVHFVLATNGDVLAQASWRDQRMLDSDGCIRIGLVAASVSGAGSQTQLRALRALIDTLNVTVTREAGHSEVGPLQIVLDAGQVDRAVMEAVVRQLREIWAADRA